MGGEFTGVMTPAEIIADIGRYVKQISWMWAGVLVLTLALAVKVFMD